MYCTGGGGIKEYPYKIYINKPPNKTTYTYNDPLSIEGLEVIVEIYDGEEVSQTNVTNECTFNPTPGSLLTTIGQNELVITYEYNGLTYTVIQDLEVENTLQSIAVTTMPDKTEYNSTEPFGITGLVVTATYANGATADVTQKCVYTPAVGETFTGIGSQAVSVSYTENGVTQVTRFNVNVLAKLQFHGQASDLLQSECDGMTVASIGNYALFAGGGLTWSSQQNIVTTYTADLTRGSTGLSMQKGDAAGASIGNYALIAGGKHTPNSAVWTGTTSVDAYTDQLVRSSPTALSDGRGLLAGASVGNYALFAGGGNGRDGTVNETAEATVDAYDADLVHSTATSLAFPRQMLAGASVGNYALFAGGSHDGQRRANVDAYNQDLVKSTPTPLTEGKYNLAGASVGNYAIFAAGYNTSYCLTVDAYNNELVKSTLANLEDTRRYGWGVSMPGFAVFSGHIIDNNHGVDAYNMQLVRSSVKSTTASSMPEYDRYGTSVGNYALFGSGHFDNTVNVYTLA